MDDLISRQAAIDQLHQSYNLLDAEQRLEDLPSAQPEIIRCKDCTEYHRHPNTRYCVIMESTMPEDGFCSYAERM